MRFIRTVHIFILSFHVLSNLLSGLCLPEIKFSPKIPAENQVIFIVFIPKFVGLAMGSPPQLASGQYLSLVRSRCYGDDPWALNIRLEAWDVNFGPSKLSKKCVHDFQVLVRLQWGRYKLYLNNYCLPRSFLTSRKHHSTVSLLWSPQCFQHGFMHPMVDGWWLNISHHNPCPPKSPHPRGSVYSWIN